MSCTYCDSPIPKFHCEHCPNTLYCNVQCQTLDADIHLELECIGKSARGKLSKHQQKKMRKVMREFASGTLKSGSGHIVTDKKQALAIAYSEARKS